MQVETTTTVDAVKPPTTQSLAERPAASVSSAPLADREARWRRGEAQLDGNYLSDVSFVDARHGWAVGGWSGVIVGTEDGGATWRRQVSNTQSELTGVSFVDLRHGWAVGFAGTILATVDGGVTWKSQANPGGDYLAVSFVDRSHGWAVGNCGVISATTDGGATWTVQVAPPAPLVCDRTTLTDVAFADSKHGWAVGGDVILITADGGRSWARQSSPRTGLYDAFLLDARHGWIVGSNTILTTVDGGVSWTIQDTGLPDVTLLGVTFATPNRGWVVGIARDGDEYGVILGTTDGGRTWVSEGAPSTAMLRGVTAQGPAHAWAVGTDVFHR
jgi:photosystem II stability/assembly factor-like uncharacterized protein